MDSGFKLTDPSFPQKATYMEVFDHKYVHLAAARQ